jgi:hypothetical protein
MYVFWQPCVLVPFDLRQDVNWKKLKSIHVGKINTRHQWCNSCVSRALLRPC